MPVLEIQKIFKREEDQEQYIRASQEMERQKEVLADLEAFLEHIYFPPRRAVPDWIRKWAEEFGEDGLTLEEAIEEARRISRKFKTPLSEEVIAEREERR